MEYEEYAIYISFQALVGFIDLLSSAGIQTALYRYLPELRASGNNISMYRMMAYGLSLRIFLIILFVVIILLFIEPVSTLLNFSTWAWLLPWYLCIGVIRLSVQSLSQTMESLLWQKDAQYSLVIGSVLRFILVMSLIIYSEVSFANVIIIEIITESITFMILLFRLYIRWKADNHRYDGDRLWWNSNNKRVIKFGILSYFIAQSSLLYGSAPNRLLISASSQSLNLAGFGFADGFANMVRRFMPTRLLIGFIRPLFMARYSNNKDFSQLNRMSSYIFMLNIVILILPVILLIIIGEPLFDWLTAGKYGVAAYLLAGFLLLIMIEGLYLLLEVILLALEKNQIIIYGNLVKSASLLLAIPMINIIGVWSLIVVNIIGSLGACCVILVYLYMNNYVFTLSVKSISACIINGVISGLLGITIVYYYNAYISAFACIVISYLILAFIMPPLNKSEITKTIEIIQQALKIREKI
jgi:O-antigen/teichoic acid export membrane protein